MRFGRTILVAIAACLGFGAAVLWGTDGGPNYEPWPHWRVEDVRIPSVAEFLAGHPSFRLDPSDSATIRLPPGEHVFDETVVVPAAPALVVEAGAVIRLGPGRSLVSYSPVHAVATATRPIVVAPAVDGHTWGTLAVVDAAASKFVGVTFLEGSGATVNGNTYVGSLSLVGSDVEVRESEFRSMRGKDAVNVRDARGLIVDNHFSNLEQDGVDFDGGRGEVRGNRFEGCGDESVDLDHRARVRVAGNRSTGCEEKVTT